jgi:hypothetical protein
MAVEMIANEAVTFDKALLRMVADGQRRAWEADNEAEKAEAYLNSLDALIVKAGYDPYAFVCAARELALQSYKSPQA